MLPKCSQCNTESQSLTDFEDKPYCPTCLEELTSICGQCEGRFDNDDGEIFQDSFLCQRCLDAMTVACFSCNSRVPNNEFYSSSLNDENYCSDCYHDRFTSCCGCSDEICLEDARCRNGDYFCDNCGDPSSNSLLAYDYRPKPKFYGRNENDLYFGIEVEAETENDNINEAVDLMPEFVYCKQDGSLDEDKGIEIVSHPLSWKWIQSHKKQWNKILDIRQIGFRSYDTETCGIHVHLSKKAFSTLHLYRFIKLFYDNGDKIIAISQRHPDRLKQWATLEDETGETIAYKAKYKTCSYRYSAINLQNSDTVEIRIFRGTLRQNSFYKNLEFCHATFYYTKQVELTSSVCWAEFTKYVMENKKTYRNLIAFMKERNLCALQFTNPKTKTSTAKP